MKKRFTGLLFILFLFLFGCTINDEEIQTAAIDQTKAAFEAKPPAANDKSGSISYYLPEGYQAEAGKTNNVIFNKGDQQYILFVNENEKETSSFFYDTLLEQYKDPLVNETFEDKGRFGYILVDKLKADDEYEVSAGIGGVKMTTQTKSREVADAAEQMMKIISSVSFE
ncbi:hypothetical protein [Metabacillus sp. SLBN-84]